MPDNSIDIKGGNNQILPNAEKAVQKFSYQAGSSTLGRAR